MRGFSIGFLALSAGFGLSSAARASFELVMVADLGTKSIHRFDGSTGTYLGSFGSGFLVTPDSLAIDSSTGIAYVGDSGLSRVRAFNYNTGVLVGDLTHSSAGISQTYGRGSDGSYYFGYTVGGYFRYAANGAPLGSINIQSIGGFQTSGMGSVAHRSGRQILSTYRTNATANAALQISSGSGLTSFKSTDLTNMGGWGTLSQLALQGDRGIWMAANGVMQTFEVLPSGNSLAFGAAPIVSGLLANSSIGVGFGHGDTVYVSGRNSANTSGVIGRYLYGSGVQISSFGSGIIQTPGMVQVVVAPEPGSMIALGLGLAGIVGRRRAMRKSA